MHTHLSLSLLMPAMALVLSACPASRPSTDTWRREDQGTPVASLNTYRFTALPTLGRTPAGQEVLLGGFSGLYFEGFEPETGFYRFITHPDRGPTVESVDLDGDGIPERPYVLPDYQARWVRFTFNPDSAELTITGQTLLTRGTPITGLPNLPGREGMAYSDEEAVDLLGHSLEYDPYGGDLEGIVGSADGTYWMVDEYRPSIYHFSEDGVLIDRFVPKGSNARVNTGVEALPRVYAQRRTNRGFEAVAYAEGILYAFIQSPIDNPDLANDSSSKASILNRILAFDTRSSATVGEYLYVIEGGSVDKIGDAVAIGNGEFLVLERDAERGARARKYIFRINLADATNLQDLNPRLIGPNGGLEQFTLAQLAARGIRPVQKSLYIDLVALGYSEADKPEGLALVDEHTIAVLNDNDFGVSGSFDPSTGALMQDPNPDPSILGIIRVTSPGRNAGD